MALNNPLSVLTGPTEKRQERRKRKKGRVRKYEKDEDKGEKKKRSFGGRRCRPLMPSGCKPPPAGEFIRQEVERARPQSPKETM